MYFPCGFNGERAVGVDYFLNDVGKILGYPRQYAEKCGTAFPVDVQESADGYLVYVDLPGVMREEIDASMDGTTLTISVKDRPAIELQKDIQTLHRERVRCCGTRDIELPLSTGQQVEASFRDGVLSIEIKKDEAKKARKIQIA